MIRTPGFRAALALSLLMCLDQAGNSARGSAFAQPSPTPVITIEESIATLREQFTAHPESATQLLATGESKRNDELDPIEHATYTALCNLVFNLDETLTKE